MTVPSRSAVLGLYRRLLRARLLAFEGDSRAIVASRERIRKEFLNNREADEKKASKLFKVGQGVEAHLVENVMQAMLKDDKTYELKITERTKLLDNVVSGTGCAAK